MLSVSALIPIHKKSHNNYNAINSILNQTYKNINILILIDGKNEILFEELKSHYMSHIITKKITIFFLNQQLGLTKILNKGIQMSFSDLILRNDYDDISHPDRVEKLIEAFNIKKINLAYSKATFFYLNGFKKDIKPPSSYKKLKDKLKYKNPIAHSSVMFRRIIDNKITLYDENFEVSQDFELWSRLVHFHIDCSAYINENLVNIYESPQSISNNKKQLQRLNSIKICLLNRFNFNGDFEKNKSIDYQDNISALEFCYLRLPINKKKLKIYFLILMIFINHIGLIKNFKS